MPGKGLLRFTRIPRWAGLLAVACAVVFGAGAASASSAGNHSVFSDPAGDNEQSSSTVYASDIRQVDITSQDSGVVKLAVTLVDGPARLVSGDELGIYIDYDRKQSTGQSGFDLELVATGGSSGTTFVLCRLGQLTSCEQGPSGWAHDLPTVTSTHVVDFTLTMGVAAFDFGVIETYKPNTTTTLSDIAPNTGLWTFETKADPDGDGLFGSADKCPSVPARGKFDRNNNGCPGPFPLIREQVHSATTRGRSHGFLQVQKLWLTGLPAGATVVLSSSRGTERLKANASGTVASRRVRGNSNTAPDFRWGSVITVRATKPGVVGLWLKLVAREKGLLTGRRLCIPATGSSAAVKCTAALRGS